MKTWVRIGKALKRSDRVDGQALARDIVDFLRQMP